MANDRMWLVHKPTGKKSLIAKHFGSGWLEYTGSKQLSFNDLFDQTPFQNQDFVIEYEDVD